MKREFAQTRYTRICAGLLIQKLESNQSKSTECSKFHPREHETANSPRFCRLSALPEIFSDPEVTAIHLSNLSPTYNHTVCSSVLYNQIITLSASAPLTLFNHLVVWGSHPSGQLGEDFTIKWSFSDWWLPASGVITLRFIAMAGVLKRYLC